MPARPSCSVTASEILIGSQRLPLTIRPSRGRSIRLGVAEGHVWLESPGGRLSNPEVSFIQSKAGWLQRVFAQVQQHTGERQRMRLNIMREARVFGRNVPIVFQNGPKLFYRYTPQQLTIIVTPRHRARPLQCIRAVLVQIARQYLDRRLRELAEYVELTFADVRIKGHRTKWGSCSTLRNINLNWYLILLDKALIDYVLLHELMHLHEMNHGPRFWGWVARYMPDYQARVKELRRHEWVIGCYEAD